VGEKKSKKRCEFQWPNWPIRAGFQGLVTLRRRKIGAEKDVLAVKDLLIDGKDSMALW